MADVDPQVVDQLLFDQFAKSPLGGQLLSRAQGNGGVGAQGGEGARVLRANRVFDEEGAQVGDGVAQLDGGRRRQPGVDLEDNFDIVADGLAQGAEMLDAAANCAAGVDVPANAIDG